jgi:hypothetical protein
MSNGTTRSGDSTAWMKLVLNAPKYPFDLSVRISHEIPICNIYMDVT